MAQNDDTLTGESPVWVLRTLLHEGFSVGRLLQTVGYVCVWAVLIAMIQFQYHPVIAIAGLLIWYGMPAFSLGIGWHQLSIRQRASLARLPVYLALLSLIITWIRVRSMWPGAVALTALAGAYLPFLLGRAVTHRRLAQTGNNQRSSSQHP